MMFEARTLRPARNPARNTVAAASSQTGQTAAPAGGRSLRAIQTQRRSSHSSGGYASGIAAKTLPWLKNHNETVKETSASRSAFRTERSRRQSTRPSRKIAQNANQIAGLLIFVPPKAPS